ncbi:MAG: YdjY domain-containing protein [Planctomycetota bacterium]
MKSIRNWVHVLLLATILFVGCDSNRSLSIQDTPVDHQEVAESSSPPQLDSPTTRKRGAYPIQQETTENSALAQDNKAAEKTDNASKDDLELPSLPDIDVEKQEQNELAPKAPQEEVTPEIHTIDLPPTWKRLSDKHEIWVDFQNKEVIAGGYICMRTGPLEVFACPRRTKEHESIVSVLALSSQIHAALLAIGATPGKPVQWPFEENEKYIPASGPVIEIKMLYRDQDKKIKTDVAQDWVTNVKTGKTMAIDWVFGGSQTFEDEESGETYYLGDSGELVCLSNFTTATMDIPVESSDANEGLLFEANTKSIPPLETKVYLKLKPVIQ